MQTENRFVKFFYYCLIKHTNKKVETEGTMKESKPTLSWFLDIVSDKITLLFLRLIIVV